MMINFINYQQEHWFLLISLLQFSPKEMMTYKELLDQLQQLNEEQTQEDFITLMNSDDKDLKDKVSQIFGKFEKFYSKVKWNSQTIKLKLLLMPLVL